MRVFTRTRRKRSSPRLKRLTDGVSIEHAASPRPGGSVSGRHRSNPGPYAGHGGRQSASLGNNPVDEELTGRPWSTKLDGELHRREQKVTELATSFTASSLNPRVGDRNRNIIKLRHAIGCQRGAVSEGDARIHCVAQFTDRPSFVNRIRFTTSCPLPPCLC
jgi:hypothetical protein